MPQFDFQAALDTHLYPIICFDSEMLITYVNQSYISLYEGAVTNFIGKDLFSFLQTKALKDAVRMRIENLSPHNIIEKMSIDGTLVVGVEGFYEWTVFANYADDGTLLWYQASGHDVTELRQAVNSIRERNEALETLQSEMRMILDSIPCNIWYKDDKNNILKLNKAAANSMGMNVENVEGQNTYDLFGENAKSYHEDDLRVINTGKPLRGIIERHTPNDAQVKWVLTDKIPFNHPMSDKIRVLVVSMDITELKEKQALLTSINKNLDDFASLTSHDLQAPLRHIGIFAELLGAEYSDYLDDEGQLYIQEIREGVDNMHMMIKSFLKFMRSSPEGVELDRIDLKEVLQNVVDQNHLELEKHKGTISLPKQKIFVYGDATLLNQVIGNLVENAIKYQEKSRPLAIDISATGKLGQWYIHVADNGIGISSNDAHQVFDLFGRAKAHSHVHGYGIGLALCKRIITLHGGNISLTQDREIGSEFVFTLNAAKPQN